MEDDAWIDAGNYCQESVHAGDYVFLEHKYIPDAMSKIVDEYNKSLLMMIMICMK